MRSGASTNEQRVGGRHMNGREAAGRGEGGA